MYNAKRCEKKFFEHLEKSNSDIEISALNNIQHNFKELEEQLFNRRITKFIKLDPTINIRELRTKMNITETLSRKLHAYMPTVDVAVRTKGITTIRKKVSFVGTSGINQQVNNNIQENTVNNSLNNNNTNIANNVNLIEKTTSEPSQDSTLDLAKILASLMEDDIPPANPNTITHTDDEHSNACNTDPATGMIEGKFVSENVFNLPSRNITEAGIKVFKKGLGFVPTPEKINRRQPKHDLEKLGRNIRLRVHLANEVTPNFSG